MSAEINRVLNTEHALTAELARITEKPSTELRADSLDPASATRLATAHLLLAVYCLRHQAPGAPGGTGAATRRPHHQETDRLRANEPGS